MKLLSENISRKIKKILFHFREVLDGITTRIYNTEITIIHLIIDILNSIF